LLWKALPGDEGPVATFADPIVRYLSPQGDDPSERGRRSSLNAEARDRPRPRLPAGHKPASGPPFARVIIPAIGVKAPLMSLGTNSDGTLQVPSRPEVTGWWRRGAMPGRKGTAVIVGHVDSLSGPAVFHDLGKLSNGDRVTVVYKSGARATFAVDGRMRVGKNDFPTDKVYKHTRGSSLRLITCTGEFVEARGHYRDNLVVFAHRVNEDGSPYRRPRSRG
jgi:LPXTG-site transpeptidase (sortase) family protein